ncbi:MAG: dimethylsulfonioproprionate lyase family protein [Pseudomonadota bacterium]
MSKGLQPLDDLIAAGTDLLAQYAADLRVTDDEIARLRPAERPPKAHGLPMLRLLPEMVAQASDNTRDLVKAIADAAPLIAWRQTYSEEDGFDESWLNNYGWFDFVADQGLLHGDGIRVMIGCWGQGLTYPDHAHPPDEHYLVLAGSGWFRLGEEPFLHLGPGEVFHTPPRAVHSAEMRHAPLLALAVWRDEDLSVRIDLSDTGRNVSVR